MFVSRSDQVAVDHYPLNLGMFGNYFPPLLKFSREMDNGETQKSLLTGKRDLMWYLKLVIGMSILNLSIYLPDCVSIYLPDCVGRFNLFIGHAMEVNSQMTQGSSNN